MHLHSLAPTPVEDLRDELGAQVKPEHDAMLTRAAIDAAEALAVAIGGEVTCSVHVDTFTDAAGLIRRRVSVAVDES